MLYSRQTDGERRILSGVRPSSLARHCNISVKSVQQIIAFSLDAEGGGQDLSPNLDLNHTIFPLSCTGARIDL